jgi:hypothetical protein
MGTIIKMGHIGSPNWLKHKKKKECRVALRPNGYSKLKNAKIFVSPISRG